MNEQPTSQIELLTEIRDLLRAREEKYDQYIKQASEVYLKQLRDQKESALHSWIWLCCAMFLAVFVSGLMLHVITR